MPRLTLQRVLTRSIPLTVLSVGLVLPAAAKEGAPLKMPKNFPAAADSEHGAALHTDLGIIGEVELVRERYPDGTIKIERQTTLDGEGNYVNHGSWKMYSTKGDVLAEGQYHFGHRIGLWTRWHGKNDSAVFGEFPFNQFKAPFMSQATFNDGVMDGQWIITDADDRKCSQVSLKMGQRHGVMTTWLPNGKIARQGTYVHGQPTGDLLEADRRTGEVQRVATYVDGRKLTTRTSYFPGKKQKKTEMMYLSAEAVEESRDQFWSVKLATYGTKGKELRHGTAKAWFADGKQEFEGFYQNGQKAGPFTYWHENGQVAATGEYENDQPAGQWVWWHANGQKSAIGQYQNGRLIGEWRWWDEAGKLTKQQVYDGTESISSQGEAQLKVSKIPSEETVR